MPWDDAYDRLVASASAQDAKYSVQEASLGNFAAIGWSESHDLNKPHTRHDRLLTLSSPLSAEHGERSGFSRVNDLISSGAAACFQDPPA